MPLVQKHYNLQNVSFIMKGGLVADATEVSIKHTVAYAERKAGRSKVMQRVIKHEDCEITVKGWNSDDLSRADIEPGTGIDSLTINSDDDTGTPSLLPASFWTKFPPSSMSFGDTTTGLTDDPSTWETQIMPNTLNVDTFNPTP